MAAAILGLAVALLFTSCLRKNLSADEIKADVLAAASEVSTVTIQQAVNEDGQTIGGPYAGSSTASSQSLSNIDSRNGIRITSVDIETEVPIVGKQHFSNQMYVVDGWLYAKLGSQNGDYRWTKMKRPFDPGESELFQQMALLKAAQKISSLGEEKLDGIDCYILQIEPDAQQAMNWLLSQTRAADISVTELSAVTNRAVKSFTFKQWISKETFLPVKTTGNVVLEILPKMSGVPFDDYERVNYSIQAQANYSDYGQPVVIVLPPEAQNARELPLTQWPKTDKRNLSQFL
jgi:hypothetical protein